MDYFVVDIEANGLDVDTVDIHCIVVQFPGSEPEAYRPHQIEAAVSRLNELLDAGHTLAGHNVIRYDVPVLRRYGMREPGPNQIYDTLLVSRAAYPGSKLAQLDKAYLAKNPTLRSHLQVGAHSLRAWGIRLGNLKADYEGGFESFNEEMLDYCIQDVAVNVDLVTKLMSRIPAQAAFLDCEVGRIAWRMHRTGFGFDLAAAEELVVELTAERAELTTQLKAAFGSWWEGAEVVTPKRKMESRKYKPGTEGYINVAAGAPYQKVKLVEFNPASTQHISKRLQAVHGWKPLHFTDTGQAQVTAEILRDLPYPEAPLLARYQEIKKVLGYLSEGTNAWLKLEKQGRLHGTMNATGTVSSRCSHNSPNLGNVPTRSELGHACRTLFVPKDGNVMVGADASGLQLRCLAHYLGAWDSGDYAKQILEGDIHSYNQHAIGLGDRSNAKTFVYALLFGAGEGKLGQTVVADLIAQGRTDVHEGMAQTLGRKARRKMGNRITGLDELTEALKKSSARGWLYALDQRQIPVASDHVGLAMLLQSAEAVIMKKALVLAAPKVYELGGEIVAMVHDEIQVECPPSTAEAVGEAIVAAMNQAGEELNLRIRIDGEYQIGDSWAGTH